MPHAACHLPCDLCRGVQPPCGLGVRAAGPRSAQGTVRKLIQGCETLLGLMGEKIQLSCLSLHGRRWLAGAAKTWWCDRVGKPLMRHG